MLTNFLERKRVICISVKSWNEYAFCAETNYISEKAPSWVLGILEEQHSFKRARGEGGNRGWDVWMASRTQWTWVWMSSRRLWRTGKPGVLRFMGSQRVGHNWATEQQQHGLNAGSDAPPPNSDSRTVSHWFGRKRRIRRIFYCTSQRSVQLTAVPWDILEGSLCFVFMRQLYLHHCFRESCDF